MFCRFCGAEILPDSQYCSKCGKRLLGSSSGFEETVRKLYLRTPYPYAGLMCLLILIFVVVAERSRVDYTELQLSLELIDESILGNRGTVQHRLSLIVENLGAEAVRNIPVAFRARAQPPQAIDIVSEFSGRQLAVLQDGQEMPLVIVLSDVVFPAEKRRYTIDGIVSAQAPAEITYEVLAENTEDVLTSFVARVRPAPRSGF